MKTRKITVNKTAQNPNGVELDIVEPENPLEAGVLSYLLSGFLPQARRSGRLTVDLPEQFTVEHKGEGSFVVFSASQVSDTAQGGTGYYQPARPLAVIGLRSIGQRFDYIFRDLRTEASQQPPPSPQPQAEPRPQPQAEQPPQPQDEQRPTAPAPAPAENEPGEQGTRPSV